MFTKQNGCKSAVILDLLMMLNAYDIESWEIKRKMTGVPKPVCTQFFAL